MSVMVFVNSSLYLVLLGATQIVIRSVAKGAAQSCTGVIHGVEELTAWLSSSESRSIPSTELAFLISLLCLFLSAVEMQTNYAFKNC